MLIILTLYTPISGKPACAAATEYVQAKAPA